MWYKNENGNNTQPSAIDTSTSRNYAYIRRNFVAVEGDDERSAHYEWEEMRIPKDMVDVSKNVFEHNEALDDVYAALTELAEIIVGEG